MDKLKLQSYGRVFFRIRDIKHQLKTLNLDYYKTNKLWNELELLEIKLKEIGEFLGKSKY